MLLLLVSSVSLPSSSSKTSLWKNESEKNVISRHLIEFSLPLSLLVFLFILFIFSLFFRVRLPRLVQKKKMKAEKRITKKKNKKDDKEVYVYSGIKMMRMLMIREDDKIQEKGKDMDICPQGRTRKLEKL